MPSAGSNNLINDLSGLWFTLLNSRSIQSELYRQLICRPGGAKHDSFTRNCRKAFWFSRYLIVWSIFLDKLRNSKELVVKPEVLYTLYGMIENEPIS